MAIEIFLASVAAISSLTQAMISQAERLDRMRALDVARQEFTNPKWTIRGNPALSQIAAKIPPKIMDSMSDQVNRCWTRLEHFIGDDTYTPDERTSHHLAARKCVCREIGEMLKYIPFDDLSDELKQFWKACGCPDPS